MNQVQGRSPQGRVINNYDEAIREGCQYVLTATPLREGVRCVFFPVDPTVIDSYTGKTDIVLYMGSTFTTDMFIRGSHLARDLEHLQDKLPPDELIEKEKEFFRYWAPHVIAGNTEFWPLYIAGRLKDEYPVDISQLQQQTVEVKAKEEPEKKISNLTSRKRTRTRTPWGTLCLYAFCAAASMAAFMAQYCLAN